MKDYYAVLGLEKTASDSDIKTQFRKLAKQYHPDTNKDSGAEDRFKEINEAYSVLSDSDKRKKYDQKLTNRTFRSSNLNDDSSFGGINLQDLFNSLFNTDVGGVKFNPPPLHRLPDMKINFPLSLKEFHNGIKKTIKIQRRVPCTTCKFTGSKTHKNEICKTCNGSGMYISHGPNFRAQTTCPTCHGSGFSIYDPCKICNGSKYTNESINLSINIDAGTLPGKVLVFDNGHISFPNDPPGKVFVVLVDEYPPTSEFRRINRSFDVEYGIEVSLVEALKGVEVQIKKFDDKKIKIKIPPRDNYKSAITCSNQGLRKPDQTFGTLLLHIDVKFPKDLKTLQKDLSTKTQES